MIERLPCPKIRLSVIVQKLKSISLSSLSLIKRSIGVLIIHSFECLSEAFNVLLVAHNGMMLELLLLIQLLLVVMPIPKVIIVANMLQDNLGQDR
jgi:hypothetical protein